MDHDLMVPSAHQPSSGSSSEGYSSAASHEVYPRSTASDGDVVVGESVPSLVRPVQLTYSQSTGGVGVPPRGVSSTFSPSSPHSSRHPGLYSTPTSSTPPTPVPRAFKVKQLEEEISRLHQEVESLRQHKDDLARQLEGRLAASSDCPGDDATALCLEVERLKDQIEKMKAANRMNVDRLTEKISTLELGGTSSDHMIHTLKEKLEVEEKEAAREREARCQLEKSLATLKVEFSRVDGERQILERERNKLREEVKNSSSSEQTHGALSRSNSVSGQGVLRRLNDTLRDKRDLEDVSL